MAEVTIGVPVYNGQDQLAESLDCLVRQTFTDIEILVFDNASTDRTQEIVESFAANDSRIKYTRRTENLGPFLNFRSPAEQAVAPYFMWRAHDDLSSLDYVDKLINALKKHPSAILATGTIQFERPGGRKTRFYVPEIPTGDSKLFNIVKLMFGSQAGWFYGLWRTEALRACARPVWDQFPYTWASDHLVLYPALLDCKVAADPGATFIQRVTPKLNGSRPAGRPSISDMAQIRNAFLQFCDRVVDERQFDMLTRLAIKTANRFYTDKRTYPIRKLIKRKIFG